MKKRFKPQDGYGFKKKGELIVEPALKSRAITRKNRGLIKAAIVYPNTYQAGMSSLGFQVIYKLVNQIHSVSCERVFWSRQKSDFQYPASIETGLKLDKFDIILFSISFENDYLNLVDLLAQSGIPLRSSHRNHIHPLVVAGGIACFLNPEPIAPFIDCFLLGEAESLLPPFFNAFSNSEKRDLFLQNLEKSIPGSYVPENQLENGPGISPGIDTAQKKSGKTAEKEKSEPLHILRGKHQKSIRVQYLDNLENVTSTTAILTRETAFKDTFLIETLKGCPHGCRFCSAGFIYRPPRIYPAQNIYSAIDNASGKTDKIGLVSSAIADHPDIMEICRYGLSQNFKLSFSSLRADKLNSGFIHALSESKIKTATLAPEAGSARMRRIINKNIDEQDILLAVKKLVKADIINLKLYFMIGLPFEQIPDIHAMVELTKKIKSVFLEESKKKRKIGTITLSLNPFIPKPCTPFQWAVMEDEKILKQKIKIIRQGLKQTPNVNLNIESLKKAKIHALLSKGDRKTADLIESALENGWTYTLRKNTAYCNSIIYREKRIDTPLPWDFIETGIDKSFLAKEFLKAEKETQTPPCPMIDCSRCRICR